jgi:hypothetical protein
MMEWIKEALSETDGQPSSSRPAMWILVGCFVFGFAFASVIIGHSYFSLGVIPSSDSILIYYLGGSAAGAGVGGGIYFANQIGNKDAPVIQPSEVLEEEIENE